MGNCALSIIGTFSSKDGNAKDDFHLKSKFKLLVEISRIMNVLPSLTALQVKQMKNCLVTRNRFFRKLANTLAER